MLCRLYQKQMREIDRSYIQSNNDKKSRNAEISFFPIEDRYYKGENLSTRFDKVR